MVLHSFIPFWTWFSLAVLFEIFFLRQKTQIEQLKQLSLEKIARGKQTITLFAPYNAN